MRLYLFKLNGKLIASEVLLENEIWEEGVTAIKSHDWPMGTYGCRLFLILLPNDQTGKENLTS